MGSLDLGLIALQALAIWRLASWERERSREVSRDDLPRYSFPWRFLHEREFFSTGSRKCSCKLLPRKDTVVQHPLSEEIPNYVGLEASLRVSISQARSRYSIPRYAIIFVKLGKSQSDRAGATSGLRLGLSSC